MQPTTLTRPMKIRPPSELAVNADVVEWYKTELRKIVKLNVESQKMVLDIWRAEGYPKGCGRRGAVNNTFGV